jgi:arsenate reductase (thioredoxin)
MQSHLQGGSVVKNMPVVLFVCVQNAGRSQMAAALLDRAADGAVDVRSAGSSPANQIHPGVLQAMREIGIELDRAIPRLLSEADLRTADLVITMGCGDQCPVVPGRRYLDWDLEDPAGKPIEVVRSIRDEIARRVHVLLEELAPGGASRSDSIESQ